MLSNGYAHRFRPLPPDLWNSQAHFCHGTMRNTRQCALGNQGSALRRLPARVVGDSSIGSDRLLCECAEEKLVSAPDPQCPAGGRIDDREVILLPTQEGDGEWH